MARVLVVDDDPMVTRLLRINLELEDFTVEEAWDGRTAMKMLHDNTPELLILDIMIPQMNGWEILRQLREDEELKELPVVILTAKVQDEDIARGWRMGADGYIVKPFNPINLAGLIHKVLATTPEERETIRKEEISRLKDVYLEG